MTNWTTLIDAVETEEVRVRQEPVEVPDGVVAMLVRLQNGTGPNGGALRASLPIGSVEEFEHIKRVLRKASDSLVPAASVTSKAIYLEADEYIEETSETGEDGVVKVSKRLRVREHATPVKISFTVGARRGRKADDAESDVVVLDEGVAVAAAPAVVVKPGSKRGKR